MEHVMAQAPGYDKLMQWTDHPIMPTPGAVGEIIKRIAEKEDISIVGVDIGGATTEDVVYLTTFVTTMEDHDTNMTIREKFFKDPPPGRSTVVAKSMGQPGSLIEFHGVAVIDG